MGFFDKVICFEIEGMPMGQPRPRFTSIQGHTRAYEPVKAKEYKSYARLKCVQALKDEGVDMPVPVAGTGYRIDIVAFKEPPKSFSRKKAIMALKGELVPVTKPDLDNVAKIVLDALNGVMWRDDSEVTALSVHKVYGERSTVKVSVSWQEETQQ